MFGMEKIVCSIGSVRGPRSEGVNVEVGSSNSYDRTLFSGDEGIDCLTLLRVFGVMGVQG